MNDDQNYEKTTLANGIRVITEHMPHVRSASIGLWVGVGSAHEEARLRGISHCIEHMLFKGTPRRSARDIAELMDSVGGNLNAFTEKEATCYHARVVDTHVPLALDILADMFRNAKFDLDEIGKEQQVILEEIRMYDDSPDEVSHDLFLRSVWAGSSLGEPTIGYAHTISALTREDITAYMATRYTSDSVILTVAGNVEHEAIVAQAQSLLGDMGSRHSAGPAASPAFCANVTIRPKDCEQVYILAGVEGTNASDDRRYPISIIDTVMGGGMASRLFQEIREQRGLAYSVYSTHNTYRTAGLFAVYASTGPNTAEQVVTLIQDEMARIAERGLGSDEIGRAKEHIKGNLLLSLESSGNRMMRLGRSELNVGRHVPPSEIAARIDAVTKEEVDSLARALFTRSGTALTVYGPVSENFAGGTQALAESA